jgi:uroporphyrinogen decarboxylase
MMQYDDPELFSDLYKKIGDLMITLWTQMLDRYGDIFCVGRMGDDLGFKSSTLMAPETITANIIPQYQRIISLIHSRKKPFLLHSCGCIFTVMDEIIAAGIDAKHSNEDQIAPFSEWISRYNDRIGLFGGIDLNVLCGMDPKSVYTEVLKQGTEYRAKAKGFALGSGNSIPNYVPVEGFMAMVEAAKEIRKREGVE